MKNILIKLIIVLIVIITTTSCVGLKMKGLEGHSKTEMFNKLGYPNKIISDGTGGEIHVYFYKDYSANNYKNVIGLLYINSLNKIIRVEKQKTRLSLAQYLYTQKLK